MTISPTHLSRRERQIMDAVYTLKQASVEQVLEVLPDPPGYSAVRALMRILEDKGHLRHITEGRKYIYLPTQPHHSATKNAIQQLISTFFGGSVELAVQTLISGSDTKLSDEQLDRIARQIEKAKRSERIPPTGASQDVISETYENEKEREP